MLVLPHTQLQSHEFGCEYNMKIFDVKTMGQVSLFAPWGYSTLGWVRMCGPKFRPPPYNLTREDTNLQPITKPFASCWRTLLKTNQYFLPYKLGCISTFWQPIGKLKEKIQRKLCILQKCDLYLNQFSNKKGAIGKPERPKKHPIWAAHPRTHLSTKYPPGCSHWFVCDVCFPISSNICTNKGRNKTYQIEKDSDNIWFNQDSTQMKIFWLKEIFLTGGIWQKWKRVFLTCPCHEIYRDEAVGLKSFKNTWKITIFVKMWNLGQYRENLIFCQ